MSDIPLLCRFPTCPTCNYEMTHDDATGLDVDLYALAPDEGRTEIECPSCGVTYYCQGAYVPTYTTALDEDQL
jgi:hypothetical protein